MTFGKRAAWRAGALRSALAALLMVGWWAGSAPARALDVPALPNYVNDYGGLLDPGHRQALESKLATYEQATGHQFLLLTVPTLDGDPIEDFSIRTVEKQKLGMKGRDDGLLMIFAVQDRKMRIEVGYGLEGEITDAFTAELEREVLQPALRAEQGAEGIDRAFDLLMAKARGIAVGVPKQRGTQKAASLFPLVLIGVVLFFLFFGGGGGGGGRRRRRGGGFVFLPGGFGGGGFGGGGGGFGGGGFGGGGGGFGGGGGGGFGGGGSSSDW
ncbi:MAG: hypothetical protein JWN48_2429 [Myxococcaceae bacterium]|nr:hypothetical protein [Myxococcaceae bacterium]